MNRRKAIGIFGGTFDPVHNGHLQMAQDAYSTLGLDEVRLVPCHRPVHRSEPVLSAGQRLELLSLAVADYSGLTVDDRELKREQRSYTIDTLRSLRAEMGEQVSLVFILGEDAYAGLTSWYCWEQLRELAHLLVLGRPAEEDICARKIDPLLQNWLDRGDTFDIVQQKPYGGLMYCANHWLAVSSTLVRQQLSQEKTSNNIPTKVLEIINQHRWYQSG